MARDESLIRAALAMAARLCNPPDQSEAARLTEFAAGCRHTMIRLEAAIRAIDPAEVLEKVGEVETTAGPWALDTSTGSEILVKGGCSVIEGEDARYLLRLIAADTSTPAPDAGTRDAVLEEAAKALESIVENWDCGHPESRLCDCGPYVEQWGFAADEVRALKSSVQPEPILSPAATETVPVPVARLVEAAMHLLSEYDAPNPVDDAVSKLRTALVACKEARDD